MKKIITILLLTLFATHAFGRSKLPLFSHLPQTIQQDIALELKYALRLSEVDLRTLLKQVVLVADISRAMPGFDRGYLAIIEDPLYGDVMARFDIGIIYGSQGAHGAVLANLINYSIASNTTVKAL